MCVEWMCVFVCQGVGHAAFIPLAGPASEHSFLVAVGPVPVFISCLLHVSLGPRLLFSLALTSCVGIDHVGFLPGLLGVWQDSGCEVLKGCRDMWPCITPGLGLLGLGQDSGLLWWWLARTSGVS